MSTETIWSFCASADAMPILTPTSRTPPRFVNGADGVRVGREDLELLSTDPGHDVARPGRLAEPRAHLAQHFIAGQVAKLIVDELEVVHVDREHRNRVVAADRTRHFTHAQLVEARAVEAPRQRIGEHDGLQPHPHLVVGPADHGDRVGHPVERLVIDAGEITLLRPVEQRQHAFEAARHLAVQSAKQECAQEEDDQVPELFHRLTERPARHGNHHEGRVADGGDHDAHHSCPQPEIQAGELHDEDRQDQPADVVDRRCRGQQHREDQRVVRDKHGVQQAAPGRPGPGDARRDDFVEDQIRQDRGGRDGKRFPHADPVRQHRLRADQPGPLQAQRNEADQRREDAPKLPLPEENFRD